MVTTKVQTELIAADKLIGLSKYTRISGAIYRMSILCDEERRTKRYNICKECKHFRAITKQCKVCSCFMPIKTKMLEMTCPINKWGSPFNSWDEATTNWVEVEE